MVYCCFGLVLLGLCQSGENVALLVECESANGRAKLPCMRIAGILREQR